MDHFGRLACDNDDVRLRQAIVAALPRLVLYARNRCRVLGSPEDLSPEDLVHEAVAMLLELQGLPNTTVVNWLLGKVRSLASNYARHRKVVGNHAQSERAEPTRTCQQITEIEAPHHLVLRWLRAEAALDGDIHLSKVAEAWEAEIFGEGDVADVTSLTIEEVRACKKRIQRRLRRAPQHVLLALREAREGDL